MDQKEVKKRRGVVMKMRLGLKIPISFCALWVLTSCADQKILEDIGLITTVGYDLEGEKKVRATMVVLQIDPEAPRNIDVISSDAITSKGARLKANLKTSKELQSGQLRVALYDEEIARKSIKPYVDTLARDPSISDLTYIAVVDGSARDLLKHEYTNIPDVGQHLFNQIEQLTDKEQISNSTLQEVQQSYYSEGVDPILPILKRNRENITVVGNAIMKNDRMVGKLTPKESFYAKLIRDQYHAGSIEMTLNFRDVEGKKHKVTTVIDTIVSSRELKLLNQYEPRFDLYLKIKGRLLEIQGDVDLTIPQNMSLLEKAINKKMRKEAIKVITYSQKRDSDIFGFGEVYRSTVRHANLSRGKWHEKYKNMTYDIGVDFKLVRTGITE
jgi:spore germination protein